MLKNFFQGFAYLFQGFGLILRPGVRRFFLIPLLINLAVFSLLTWLGIDQFGMLLNLLLPAGEGWWEVAARTLLWLVFAAAVLLIMFFTFTLIANLIGSPFNGLLSEKIEEILSGEKISREGAVKESFLKEIPQAMMNELHKFVYFLVFSGLALVLSLIPVVNFLFPFFWIALTSWMLSLEYLGYPMENHGMSFKEARKKARDETMMSLGFGLAVMCGTLIPIVNFLAWPFSLR